MKRWVALWLLCMLIVAACGTVVDRFEMEARLPGNDTLELKLDTDMPDDMVVDVGMGRVFTTPDYRYTKERPTNLFFAELTASELREGITIDLAHENRDFYPLVLRRIGKNPDWGRVEITSRHYAYMGLPPVDSEGLTGKAVKDARNAFGEVIGKRLYDRHEFRWGRNIVVKEE